MLTVASGTTMLLAASAQQDERTAVEQRYRLDQATSQLGNELFALTGHVRDFVVGGDPTYVALYHRDAAALADTEARVRKLHDMGASTDELNALREGIRWAGTLTDEQQAAIAARLAGDDGRARQIIFGAEYEREHDRAEGLVERFQYRLDQRTSAAVAKAVAVSMLWRRTSEIVLGITGLMFLCVLYFVFKRRVLRPVLRLSDVVSRLAAQDYAAEPPDYEQIDEIGDMAQALRIFRENGIARQRLEVERDLDRTRRELLSRMMQRMQGSDAMQDLEEVVQRFVPQIAPELAGRFYLLDVQRAVMVERCKWLSPTQSIVEFPPSSCWALRRGTLHQPGGDQVDVPCSHLAAHLDPPLNTLCLPLISQRETLGLLYFEARSDVSHEALVLPLAYLKILAENISLAAANLRLRDALRDLAMTDPLTGLANRRGLDETINLRSTEHELTGLPISCVMLDVDHFKRFNSEFGHDAGDAVLREVGAVLQASTRDLDPAFRYGGEEFLFLMPGTDAVKAQERAEEIRDRIQSLRVIHNRAALGTITASFGVASTPEHCRVHNLVRTADAALRVAKENGRNRVIVARTREHELS